MALALPSQTLAHQGFADKSPVFYFEESKTASPESETKRYYFHREKLINVIVDYYEPQGEHKKYSMDRNFYGSDLKEGKIVLQKARNYAQLFQSLTKASNWK